MPPMAFPGLSAFREEAVYSGAERAAAGGSW
jgi:hypothetical protein